MRDWLVWLGGAVAVAVVSWGCHVEPRPADLLLAAWPGDPRLIRRLIGR
jgi:hypothetical protein